MEGPSDQQAPLDHSTELTDDFGADISGEFDEDTGDLIEDEGDLIEEDGVVLMDDVMDEIHSEEEEVMDPADYIDEQVEGYKKVFQCGYCSYSTNRQSDLKRHVFSHTGENLYHCSKCEYKTARKSDLRRHQLLHIGEKPFKCGVCHYTTSRKTVLLKHMQKHTANLPRCRVILVQVSKEGQRVINNNALADLPVSSSEKRPSSASPAKKKKADLKMYSCDKCDFVAACRKNFHEHKLSHGTEQKWKCPMCGYLTIRKSDMTRHFNIHIDNVFKCNLCEYKTVRNSDFIRHNKVHEKHSYRESEYSNVVE